MVCRWRSLLDMFGCNRVPLKEWSNVGFSFPWVAVLVTVVSMIALAVGQLSDSLWHPFESRRWRLQLSCFVSFTRKFP